MNDRDALIAEAENLANELHEFMMSDAPDVGSIHCTAPATIRALISLASPSPAQTEWRQWLSRQLLDDRLSDQEAANVVAFHPSITDEWRKTPSPGQTERETIRPELMEAPRERAGRGRQTSPSPAQWPEDVVERAAIAALQVFGTRNYFADVPIHQADWQTAIRAALATLHPPAEPNWYLVDRRDVVKMLGDVAEYHADLAISGEPSNAGGREYAEAALTRAKYAVAFMPAADRSTLPPPEDERVKGLVEALEAVMTACRFVDEDSGQIQSPQELQDAFDAFISASPQPEVKP